MRDRVWTMVAVIVMAALCFASSTSARDLTFDDRVRAQEAIERVYNPHQLGATKPFEEAVPRQLLEDKVRRYSMASLELKRTGAVAITQDLLERELARIAQRTRLPERLHEIYTALGNDPVLVLDCFARSSLVTRLHRERLAETPALDSAELGILETVVGGGLRLPDPALDVRPSSPDTCRPDGVWDNGILQDVYPKRRSGQPAVWTGNEMIIWRGGGSSVADQAFRYDPLLDTWRVIPRNGASELINPILAWTAPPFGPATR